MNSREALEQEIEQLEAHIQQLEAQLKPRKAALAALLKEALAEGQMDSPAARFFDKDHYDSMREILQEQGKRITKAELRKRLLDGGAAIGRKYPEKALDVAIKANARNSKITRSGRGKDMPDSELIGLPEWTKKR
jgi:hypothetical protein